jgi:hypothetical protein
MEDYDNEYDWSEEDLDDPFWHYGEEGGELSAAEFGAIEERRLATARAGLDWEETLPLCPSSCLWDSNSSDGLL